jgi:hypothetical protein
MILLRGQASWAKMISLRGKLTVLACHPTEFVNKVEQQTFLSTNIASGLTADPWQVFFQVGYILV